MRNRRRLLQAAAMIAPPPVVGGPSDWRGMIPRGSETAPYGGSFSASGWYVPPAYPTEPPPLGAGTRKTAANATELNALLPNLVPGDVVVLTGTSYVNVNWNGGSGASTSDQNLPSGTVAAPIVFYSQALHSAKVTRTNITGGSVRIKTWNTSYMEWWGIDVDGADRSAMALNNGAGLHAKWCDLRSDANNSVIRHLNSTDSGLWFSAVANPDLSDNNAEGHYVGWGSDVNLYSQDNIYTIGTLFTDCNGGSLDIKPNTTNYLAEFNVCDVLDAGSGGVNLNDGFHLLTPANQAGKNETDIVFRHNIVKVRRAGSTNGDAVRTGGNVSIVNNILFTDQPLADIEDAIFCYVDTGINVNLLIDSNRMFGFDRAFSFGTNGSGSTNTMTGDDNRSSSALNGVNGTVVADSVYVGPTSGDAIADATAQFGGIGTGFEMVGAAGPYEVV